MLMQYNDYVVAPNLATERGEPVGYIDISYGFCCGRYNM